MGTNSRRQELRPWLVDSSPAIRRIVTSRAYSRLRIRRRDIRFDALAGQHLARLLAKPDPTILDVGANNGEHTKLFLRLFKNPTVHAFEPDPRAMARFRGNVRDRRATLFPIAISNRDGTTTFHMSGGGPAGIDADAGQWDASGSIHQPTGHLTAHPGITFEKTIHVPTKRLDTWATEVGISVIDLIWADVQGAERELIEGGRETLQRTRFLYTEYSDRELYEGQLGLAGILGLIPNFAVVELFPENVLLRNTKLRL